MAEIKITDLPLMTLEDFTPNDRFLMIDNGDARAMPKTVFDEWVAANVQGVQGEQGVRGSDGLDGSNGLNGTDGVDGLSAYQIAVSQGFVGTVSQWVTSLKGATGASGTSGSNGWSPVIKTVANGSEVVLQLFDWIGGTGTKPTTLGYLGSTGIVTNIANALNVKGSQGLQGIQGEVGEKGDDGIDGKTVSSIVFKQDQSVTVTYSDNSTVSSEPPPTQYGWGVYKDGQYGELTPLSVSIGSQLVLPNNATVVSEVMPSEYNSFYNPTTQKYLLQDSEGWYTIKVRFKVTASNQPSYFNLSMSDGTTDPLYIEDKTLRGDGQIQYVDLTANINGNTALSSNGLSISIKSFERAISIYDVEVSVAKLI